MKLIIINEQGERDLIVEKKSIRKRFQGHPFLHLVFNKKKWIVTFCSISKMFFVMDKEVFNLFGRSFLAKNRRLPFRKITPYFHFFSPVITSTCNLKCSYCFGKGGERVGGYSSWTMLKAAVDYMGEQNKPISVIFASPGEQISDFKLLEKTLKYIKKKLKIKSIMISTNGTGSSNAYLKIIDDFDIFQISSDGPPEIQDKQRPIKGSGESSILVEKTIKKFVKENKKFIIKTVVTSLHKGREEYFFKYFYNLGVEKIILSPVRPFGGGETYLEKITGKQSWDFLMLSLFKTELKIKELCNSFGLRSNLIIERSLGEKKTHYCTLGYLFNVGTDGNVSTCPAYSDKDDLSIYKGMKDLLIGRFNYQKKRFEIDKEKVEKLRNIHKKVKCFNCDFKLCWGGCPLNNLKENKDITVPDKKSCILTKKETYELLKSLAEERVIKIKPCLIERDKKFFYSMQFNEFELGKLSKNNRRNVNKKSFFIRINPIKQDFDSLLRKIVLLSKKNEKRITLFLFSPIFSGRLNFQTSVMFKKFLFDLKRNKVLFKITKPIKITDITLEKEDEFYRDFSIPKSCFDCLEMFKIKNNRIEFCNGAKGPRINEVFDREEIYSIFEGMNYKKCYNDDK